MAEEYNDNLHKGAIGKLYQYGRELRQSSTKAEKILWEYLRNRKLDGLKFRRQHPLDKYIADFYCHEIKLVIEVDGSVHNNDDQIKIDEARSNWLNELGIDIMRFKNDDVMNKIELVIEAIISLSFRRGKKGEV